MLFNQKAVDEKMKHLDEIKQHPEYIHEVVSKHFGQNYQLKEHQRRWTGGGATSYLISSDNVKAFLKIKHKDATVESKLAQEDSYINEPCVLHEYHMLTAAAAAGVSVPKVLFFEEYEDFQFLATEYIEDSLTCRLENNSVEELLALWDSLEANVKKLFDNGLVHGDIHEYNLRCRSASEIVIIDLEECREFRQNCCFEESLDYTGKNGIYELGKFPLYDEQKYTVHLNCLARMRQVFKDYVAAAAARYISECNYDSSNGICITIDHGKSDKTYQSIKNGYFEVSGQRGTEDKRPELIANLLNDLLGDNPSTFIDVGSNNGLFGREISKRTTSSHRFIGLEGFSKFNILARSLAFLDDCKNTEYYDFLCGEDDLDRLNINTPCFITICSVWHHIQNKEAFLNQLKKLDIAYILFELAVQEECYGHSWEEELCWIQNTLGFQGQLILGHSADYDRPIVLIAKERFSADQEKKMHRIWNAVYRKGFFDRIKMWIK